MWCVCQLSYPVVWVLLFIMTGKFSSCVEDLVVGVWLCFFFNFVRDLVVAVSSCVAAVRRIQ